MARLFARLDSQVTLVTRSRLLLETEPEVSAALADSFRDKGITLWPGSGIASLSRLATAWC